MSSTAVCCCVCRDSPPNRNLAPSAGRLRRADNRSQLLRRIEDRNPGVNDGRTRDGVWILHRDDTTTLSTCSRFRHPQRHGQGSRVRLYKRSAEHTKMKRRGGGWEEHGLKPGEPASGERHVRPMRGTPLRLCDPSRMGDGIRRAQHSDVDAMNRLAKRSLPESRDTLDLNGVFDQEPAWVGRATIAVAEFEGRVVGFLFAAPYRNTHSGVVDYRTSVLFSVCVEPAFRHSGAGSAMVSAYMQDLDAFEYRRAVAEVTPAGAGLLQSNGWTLATAAEPHQWFASGADTGMPTIDLIALAYEAWDDRAIAHLQFRPSRTGSSFGVAAVRGS